MSRHRMLLLAAGAVVFIATAAPNTARAWDIRFHTTAGGGGTTWQRDGFGYAGLHLGVRFWDILSGYAMIRFGYGAVDERLITWLGGGIKAGLPFWRFKPYIRLGGVHVHEEPIASAKKKPEGVIVGIGDGIRHRAGVDMGIGFDYTIKDWKAKKIRIYLCGELQTAWLKYSTGPAWYFSGNLGVGINYAI